MYAVKLHRFLTHIKRLDVDRAMVARSYDTMAGLGPKAAVAPRRGRHALEPRDSSWLSDDTISALRERRVALCIIDTPKMADARSGDR